MTQHLMIARHVPFATVARHMRAMDTQCIREHIGALKM